MTGLTIAGTGHRPEDAEPEAVVRRKIRNALEEAHPSIVITGMAAGFDLWLGLEALDFGCTVWAAKPWAGHTPRHGEESEYALIIERAGKVVNVDEALTYPGPWAYHNRNHWMVDNADRILAYWSGKKSGGTYACLQYAKKAGKPVRNIYGNVR